MKTFLRKIYFRVKFFLSINWIKTIYFNFRMLPYKQAKKLPVVFYGKVKFSGLSGKLDFSTPVKFGMVGFGQKYELMSVSKKCAQLYLNGLFKINGHVQFGIDYFVYVAKGACLEMGHLSSLGANGKIICTDNIKLGDYARLGYESQIIDTAFHKMKDTETGFVFSKTSPIILGNYNFIGNRVSIMKGAKTGTFCTVTSNSLLTKDYSILGENIMIGGIPAKLLKGNINRIWEEENLDFLIVGK